MLSAIGAWFAKEGIGFVVGALAKLALDGWNSWQANRAQQDLGRVTAERDQQAAARAATERELAAEQAAPKTAEDAIARLEEGSA